MKAAVMRGLGKGVRFTDVGFASLFVLPYVYAAAIRNIVNCGVLEPFSEHATLFPECATYFTTIAFDHHKVKLFTIYANDTL